MDGASTGEVGKIFGKGISLTNGGVDGFPPGRSVLVIFGTTGDGSGSSSAGGLNL